MSEQPGTSGTPLSAALSMAPLIAAGASGRVFALDEARVAKLFHAAVSDEMVEREAMVAELARQRGLPVAAPLGRLDAGGRGIVYPRLDGETMLRTLHRTPWRAPALFSAMAALQENIHAQRVDGLRPVKVVLDTDIRYGPAPVALQDAACDYLTRLPDGQALLHGDFHPGNIMLTARGPFVIDWAKAASGAPAADLVRTEMLVRFGQGGEDWLTNRWRDWAAARLAKAALRSGAVGQEDLDAWRPVVALAWLRARTAVRQRAFVRYLDRALQIVGLPRLTLP